MPRSRVPTHLWRERELSHGSPVSPPGQSFSRSRGRVLRATSFNRLAENGDLPTAHAPPLGAATTPEATKAVRDGLPSPTFDWSAKVLRAALARYGAVAVRVRSR
ncbi:MAG: hypothetical protein M3N32_06365 [Actinomycetota bacterium]|nr:hypothetical protein [Actinomycetota bacterium]